MKKTLASLMAAGLLLGAGLAATTPAHAISGAVPIVAEAPKKAEMPAPPQEYEFEMRRNGTEAKVLKAAEEADKLGKKGHKGRVQPQPPARGKAKASCGSPSVCYDYNGFEQWFTTDPADDTLATMTIGKPYVDNSVLGGAHSLGQVDVESANGGDRVEVGWTVDKAQRADGNPILFASHNIAGVWKGYTTGWVDYAPNPINIGAGLPKPVDKAFGINQTSTAFWFWYDTDYVAYVPKSRWTPGGVVQPFNATVADFHRIVWFFESASHETETCNDMGTSTIYNASGVPTPPVAIITNYSAGNTAIAEDWTVVRPNPTIAAWGTQKDSATSGRGGGPGYNSAGTGVGTAFAC
jgi:hypothetical protein